MDLLQIPTSRGYEDYRPVANPRSGNNRPEIPQTMERTSLRQINLRHSDTGIDEKGSPRRVDGE